MLTARVPGGELQTRRQTLNPECRSADDARGLLAQLCVLPLPVLERLLGRLGPGLVALCQRRQIQPEPAGSTFIVSIFSQYLIGTLHGTPDCILQHIVVSLLANLHSGTGANSTKWNTTGNNTAAVCTVRRNIGRCRQRANPPAVAGQGVVHGLPRLWLLLCQRPPPAQDSCTYTISSSTWIGCA